MSALRLLLVAIVALSLAGCAGRMRQSTSLPRSADVVVERVEVAPVQIASVEDNPDADAYDAELKNLAAQELQQALRARSITNVAQAPLIVETKIHMVYGKRALRIFVGWGAGSGEATVDILLRDRKSGQVVYATHTEGYLRRGVLMGSDMMVVARRTVKKAVTEFVEKL